jgi:5-methylcytosine-specific restriction endonuclease McrA
LALIPNSSFRSALIRLRLKAAGSGQRHKREEPQMQRKRPFERCQRRWVPGRLRAEIMLRQDGRCADCGTRLILGFFIFDHRPPLALREEGEDANDPDRLAAICTTCDEQKTPRDLKEIAKAKRLALEHQDFLERRREKVPGRRASSWRQRKKLEQEFGLSQPEIDEGTTERHTVLVSAHPPV